MGSKDRGRVYWQNKYHVQCKPSDGNQKKEINMFKHYSKIQLIMKSKCIISVLVFFFCFSTIAQAQIIVLTLSSISNSLKPADKKLMSNIKGDWIIQEVEIDGKDVIAEFEGVKISFPKCKGKEYKAGNCQAVEIYNDDKTDYFKVLLEEESKVAITSRKEINKAAKAEDKDYTKVKYELVEAKGSKYEFSFKYKKNKLRIETIGSDHSEYFLLVRPPKKKKKK